VTPEKTPEEIEREMLHTRESLTEKVEALETQVVGTVEAVKSFVTTAPETVSDTVKQAAAAVSESVKETFDIPSHIRRHPLAAVGTAALVGCTVSWLLTRSRGQESHMTAAMSEASVERPPIPAPPPSPASAPAPAKPGILDELFGMLGDKAKQLLREALESTSSALKESIQTQVPRLVNDMSSRLVDAAEGARGEGETTFVDRFDARRGSV